MNIGSGFSKIGNLYITPRYPSGPVNPIKAIDSNNGGSMIDISQINQNSAPKIRQGKPVDTAFFNEISRKMKFDNYESVRDLGTLNIQKAMNENLAVSKNGQNFGSATANHITLSLPDGRFIVGYLVDLFA